MENMEAKKSEGYLKFTVSLKERKLIWKYGDLIRVLNIHIERRLKTICMNISAVMISGWWDYE